MLKQRLKDTARSLLQVGGLDVRFAEKHDAVYMQRQLLAGRNVDHIIDAGAFHGEWTEKYRRSWPHATVHAFEPFPASLDILRRTVGRDPRVEIVPKALAAETGARTFFMNRRESTNSLLRTAWSAADAVPDPTWFTREGEITVMVTTVDAFCNERKIDSVNVLKLDVQGAEIEVLRGAMGLLKGGRIDIIYSELLFATSYVGQPYCHDVAALLHALGYALFGLYNLFVLPNGRMCQADGIFLSPQLWRGYERR